MIRSSLDTIVALSSGPPPSGVAIVRASGPAARDGLARLIGTVPPARRAVLCSITDPSSGMIIDRGLAIFFPRPASFTGEDVFELHVHGGKAVVAALLAATSRLTGFRLAEAGEFTRRAFEAGKLDLTEVEGLADLVAAETEMQRRQALGLLGGRARQRVEDWRSCLLELRARLEAGIDFADEEGVPANVWVAGQAEIATLAGEMTTALGEAGGERVRDGVSIVIVGNPNAGKSSLLNALAARDVAIVSEEAGTTRDLIEVHLDLGGYAAFVVDTAGLREGAGRVEQEGVRRAKARAGEADMVLALGSPDVGWPDWQGEAVRVLNKADLLDSDSKQKLAGTADHFVSAATGEGLGDLIAGLALRIGALSSVEMGVISRARHREALLEARDALLRAGSVDNMAVELTAEELRAATGALGRLTGRIGVEEVLGRIFSEFCISK